MLEYKGYVGQVEFDDSVGIFHGRVINTRDIITFEGTSVKEIQQALQGSVDDYLEWCAERGEEPDKPFSGKFTVRIDPELHRKYIFKRNQTMKVRIPGLLKHWNLR